MATLRRLLEGLPVFSPIFSDIISQRRYKIIRDIPTSQGQNLRFQGQNTDIWQRKIFLCEFAKKS
jgi:hypothetical protein